jgi:hypothetical protein
MTAHWKAAPLVHDEARRATPPAARLLSTLAALAAGTLGYAFAAAMEAARASDAFIVPPTGAAIGGYLLWFAGLGGLALALEFGAPPITARGGRAARGLRAAIRRRFRHGRTRAEIANVEVGLTISVCALLLAVAAAFATTKSVLAIVMMGAVYVTLQAARSLGRLVAYDIGWSALIGFLYGMTAGYMLT